MTRFPRIAVLLALAAFSGWGCTDEEAAIKLVKVTGTVTRNGKPLSDAQVSFIPDGGNKSSTPGLDATGSEGNYMVTFKGRTGVAAGKYKVIITAPVELPPGLANDPALAKQPYMAQVARESKTATKKKSAEVKREAAKSEFDREVEDQASGVVLDFDVKSTVTAAPAASAAK
jgi:hypothetical protein